MKQFTLIALFGVCLSMSGCPQVGTGSGKYHDAVVAEHEFKTAVKAIQQAEIVEHQNGRISDADHQKFEVHMAQVGQTAQVLVTALQTKASNPTITQDFQTLVTSVNDLLNEGVLPLPNQTSVAILKASIATAQSILTDIQNEFLTPAAPTATATKG